MATVATTSNGNPLQYPAETMVDWQTQAPPIGSGVPTGHLYALIPSTTSNQYDFYRSTDGGTSWSLRTSRTRANVVEVGCLHIDRSGYLHWVYRTNDSSQDRIYYQRYDSAANAWSAAELLLAWGTNFGTPGSVLTGVDFTTVNYGPGGATQTGLAAIGAVVNGKHSVILSGVTAGPNQQPYLNNNAFSGPRTFSANTGTGRVSPSIDIEHTGDGKSYSWPNVWITFGRIQLWVVKGAWNGWGWILPSAPVAVTSTFTAVETAPARWSGSRLIAVRLTGGSAATLYERNAANTSTTERSTPAHPQGVIRSVGLGYNSITQDPRVYGVGTSTSTLYYVDYIRASDTWTSWTQVSATAILGAGVDNYQIRRGSGFNNKVDVLLAHATPTPNTVVNVQQSLTYAPYAPTWDLDGSAFTSGGAANSAADLLLNWTFQDPDLVNDAQTAYALSRQQGVDPVEYWRASDGTWQPTEQKNTSSTTQVTLPAGFVDRFDTAAGAGSLVSVSGFTLIESTAQKHSGSQSVQATVSGSPTTAYAASRIPAEVGKTYYVGVWIYSAAGVANATVQIRWLNIGLGLISTTSATLGSIPAATWTYRSHSAVAPASSAYIEFGPALASSPANGTQIYFDDLTLTGTPSTGVPWASADDPIHQYKVKTWDGGDVASPYSDALVLVPSAQVNPTMTFPVDAGTVTTRRITVTWTVAEQTAYQVALVFGGDVVYDTGKVNASATSFDLPYDLTNGGAYTVRLWTWNLDGLQSALVDADITVAFIAPLTPTVTVTPLPASGVMRVTVANPDPAVFVNAGTAANADNATLNPGLPASLAAGDLLLDFAAIRNSGTGTPNLPAGYATVVSFANMAIYSKVAGASESAPSQSFTGGAAGATTSAQTAAFRRAGATVIGAAATQLNGSGQNIAYPAFTPSADNCVVLLAVWKQAVNTGVTTPAGFTLIANTSSALGSGHSIAWYRQIQTVATPVSSGTITVTGGVSAISRAVLVAVSAIPDVISNDLYRRVVGDSSGGELVAAGVDPDGVVDDFRVLSGVAYEFLARAAGANGTSIEGEWTP